MATDARPLATNPCLFARLQWEWLLAALLLGCEAVRPASASAVESTPASAQSPQSSPAIPLADMTPPPAGDERFEGVVEQRLEAGAYAYLAVRSGDALRWVATMGEGRPPGTRVVVKSMGTRTDFFSRRLDRTFSELVFGVVDDAV